MFACLPAAQAGTVEVSIGNVANANGRVVVSLCDNASFLKRCAYRKQETAVAGKLVLQFADVPPGRYAVMAFHDADDNGKLNRSIFGLPTEGYGFSRNPRMQFGPPEFNDTAFEIGAERAEVALRLKY